MWGVDPQKSSEPENLEAGSHWHLAHSLYTMQTVDDLRMEAAHKKRKFGHTASKLAPRKRFAADALPWKTVDVGTGSLLDAEGFFGLEEVEGVEVVKHGDKVEFVSAYPGRSPTPWYVQD